MPAARTLRAISAAGMFAMLAMVSTPTRADVYECLVVGVADGDTLTARCGSPGLYEQVRVRLSGIDAPEKGQPFGTRARMALGALVFGRIARLECPKSDRYGRKVCSVWVAPVSAPTGPPTLDAGLAMVRLGMAWWYRAYAREQRPEARGQYESAEHEARAKRVGLWHDPDPMTPWDWRVANRRGGGHQIDGPTPVLQPNTRMILRSNSAVDAEWCRRILWHEGFVFEAMKGRRSATMYLRVLLGY